MLASSNATLEVTKERIIPDRAPEWDVAFHAARYTFARPFVVDKVVLDCACGVGYGSQILAKSQAKRVCAVDLSLPALVYAREHFSAPNLYFTNQNAMLLGFPDMAFDMAVTFETIEHLPNPEQFLSCLVRTLKPDGLCIASVPNKDALFTGSEVDPTIRFSPFHEREYNLAEFQALLRPFFRQSEFYYQLCPDQQLLRARQLNRLARRSHLLGLKRFMPKHFVDLIRQWRDQIGERENQQKSADDYAPRPLDPEHILEDMFVLVAISRGPIHAS